MVISHSYVSLPEGNDLWDLDSWPLATEKEAFQRCFNNFEQESFAIDVMMAIQINKLVSNK